MTLHEEVSAYLAAQDAARDQDGPAVREACAILARVGARPDRDTDSEAVTDHEDYDPNRWNLH